MNHFQGGAQRYVTTTFLGGIVNNSYFPNLCVNGKFCAKDVTTRGGAEVDNTSYAQNIHLARVRNKILCTAVRKLRN